MGLWLSVGEPTYARSLSCPIGTIHICRTKQFTAESFNGQTIGSWRKPNGITRCG